MSEHTDIGAYALGLLEPGDREAFEHHLAQCPSCCAELAELSGMKSLLTDIEPVGPDPGEPAPGEVASLLHRRAMARRRRSRWQWGLAVAASVALLAGGVGAGLALAPGHPQQVQSLRVTGVRHAATDPRTGVAALVGLVTKGWGTQVTLDLSKVHGPLECQLVAVSRTGERRVIVGWSVPPHGYGVPGHPGHLVIQGGTAISMSDLARIEVTVVHGATLVTIPV